MRSAVWDVDSEMSEVSCNSMGRDDMASPLVNLVALSLGGGALSGATLSVSCAGPSRLLLCPHPSERLANGSSRGCKRAGADDYSIGGEAAVCIKAARMAPTYLQKRPPPILVSGQDTSPQDTIWHKGSFGDDLSACSSLLDTSSTPHTATSVRRCLEDQPGFIPSCDTTPVTPEARSTSVQGFLGYMEAAALSKHGYSIEVATLLPPAFVLLDGWRARH